MEYWEFEEVVAEAIRLNEEEQKKQQEQEQESYNSPMMRDMHNTMKSAQTGFKAPKISMPKI